MFLVLSVDHAEIALTIPLTSSQYNAAEAPQAPMCHKGVAAANDVRASRVSKDQNVDWSDDGAPFRSQTLHLHDLLWFPFLALVMMQSIRGLGNKNIGTSIFWIVYESYIVFDHIPFLFTNTVYKSPKFNFTYLSTIFFWGFEAIASIVSTQSIVNAPNILFYNVVPHCFFVACNNFSGLAASKSFSSEKKKTWWVYIQVTIDNIIHSASLWYHLEYLLRQVLGTDTSTWATWAGLIVAMLVLTYWVHKDEMSILHFLAPFFPATKKMPCQYNPLRRCG